MHQFPRFLPATLCWSPLSWGRRQGRPWAPSSPSPPHPLSPGEMDTASSSTSLWLDTISSPGCNCEDLIVIANYEFVLSTQKMRNAIMCYTCAITFRTQKHNVLTSNQNPAYGIASWNVQSSYTVLRDNIHVHVNYTFGEVRYNGICLILYAVWTWWPALALWPTLPSRGLPTSPQWSTPLSCSTVQTWRLNALKC